MCLYAIVEIRKDTVYYNKMTIYCLDLEGVLVPEIWIAVSKKTGIKDLRFTTRDIPDYDVLMQQRLKILRKEGIRLKDIQSVIAKIKPLTEFDLRDGGARRRRECHSCRTAMESGRRRRRYAANPDAHERAKARNRIDRRKRASGLKVECLGAYCAGATRCACCGERAIQFLTIDHISGSGRAHRRELAETAGVKPGSDFYRWLKRSGFPAGYRVLCFNCNCAHGMFGYCPHDRES